MCEMTTVSAVIAEHGIERIDLLKIDAEGAEWDILEGIDDGDWPRIRQLAMEVHGTELTERIRALLAGKGYEVAVERNDWRLHELMGVRMLYAHR
jgi:hypothetical protein